MRPTPQGDDDVSKTPEALVNEIDEFNRKLLNGEITDMEMAALVARNFDTIAISHRNTINAVKVAMKLGMGGSRSIAGLLAEGGKK